MRVDKSVCLKWTGTDMVFEGGAPEGPQIMVDSDTAVGPSPMDLVLLGLAGCMAIDIRDILVKGHVPLDGLEMVAEGERAEKPPKVYTRFRLIVTVTGVLKSDRAKVERAVRLSEETYCSVLHSLRSGVPLEIRIEGV